MLFTVEFLGERGWGNRAMGLGNWGGMGVEGGSDTPTKKTMKKSCKTPTALDVQSARIYQRGGGSRFHIGDGEGTRICFVRSTLQSDSTYVCSSRCCDVKLKGDVKGWQKGGGGEVLHICEWEFDGVHGIADFAHQ